MLLESCTFAPPAGAFAVRNSVAEILLPPVVPPTLGVTELSCAGALGFAPTLIHAVLVTDPDCALICTDVIVATLLVVMVKLFVLLPAAI